MNMEKETKKSYGYKLGSKYIACTLDEIIKHTIDDYLNEVGQKTNNS